tara:strand:- start:1154 stop:1390 length:237 start_codon:yes stop_codon:yes gene_type:complete
MQAKKIMDGKNMKTKKYEVEIMGTTYRTYYITAESQEKAEEMAFEAVDEDWEISKAWKRNAELSYSEEVKEESENNNN